MIIVAGGGGGMADLYSENDPDASEFVMDSLIAFVSEKLYRRNLDGWILSNT